jgi:hypothetical protein
MLRRSTHSILTFQRPSWYPLVPLARKTSSSFSKYFNTLRARCSINKPRHICDQRAVRPVYEYSGPQIGPFTATVHVGTQSFQITSVVSSKKQAKEAVSKLAVLGLASVNSEGVVGIKRKAADGVVEVDKTERWVAVLHGKLSIRHTTKRTVLILPQTTRMAKDSLNQSSRSTQRTDSRSNSPVPSRSLRDHSRHLVTSRTSSAPKRTPKTRPQRRQSAGCAPTTVSNKLRNGSRSSLNHRSPRPQSRQA